MENKSNIEKIKILIKSILISHKSGMTLLQLNSDYKNLEGCQIPHSECGFHNLIDFIKSKFFDDILYFQQNGLYGQMFVFPKPSKSTAHIRKLIHEQHSPKKNRQSLFQLNYLPTNTVESVETVESSQLSFFRKYLERDKCQNGQNMKKFEQQQQILNINDDILQVNKPDSIEPFVLPEGNGNNDSSKIGSIDDASASGQTSRQKLLKKLRENNNNDNYEIASITNELNDLFLDNNLQKKNPDQLVYDKMCPSIEIPSCSEHFFDYHNVKISYVKDPSTFSIQFAKNKTMLIDLMRQLQ